MNVVGCFREALQSGNFQECAELSATHIDQFS